MGSFRLRLLLLAFSALIVCSGCGDGHPTRVPISGQILIDGKPLKCGTVRFIPTGHRASQGKLDENGRFTLSCYAENDGAVVGKHKIEVSGFEMVKPTLMRWQAPKKYQDQATSGLTQEITEPTDNVVINLTWDGGKPFDEVYYAPGADYKNLDADSKK
jgi:hypothetical protein